MTTTSAARPSIAGWLLVCAVLAIGVLGVASLWTGLAVFTGRHSGWMALVGAADAALLLRLLRAPRSRAGAIAALIAAALTVLTANFFIVATQYGLAFGLAPLDSTLKLGIDTAWTAARLSNGSIDIGCALLALPLAWWWAR